MQHILLFSLTLLLFVLLIVICHSNTLLYRPLSAHGNYRLNRNSRPITYITSLGSRPPRSVRVLIMRMRKRQTFEERGFPVASFPGSPSFRAIIPRMTFHPPEGKAEGEPGNEATSDPRSSNICRLRMRVIKTRTERGRPGTEASI